jgi:hypothetical protein
VVRQVEAQQPVLEAIARAMTATLRAAARFCGAATAAAPATRSTWPQSLWAGFAASGAAGLNGADHGQLRF